jgi:hypothetical protein
MSALIENIHRTLKDLTIEWNWELTYAPKPGQNRIKFTAINRYNPKQRKVLILTEELVKQVPILKLANNIIHLLPTLPECPAGESPAAQRELTQPMKRVELNYSARERYEMLRRRYQGTLDNVRANNGPAVTITSNSCESNLAETFGKSLQRVLQQISRKTTTH